MSWLFGKKKTEKASNPNGSIETMRETIDILDKREKLLDKKCQEEIAKAKDFLARKNKNAAMLCMKRKKNYEEQIMRLNSQRLNIESMMMKLEEATIDMETYQAQKLGASALKKVYGKTSVDTIDKDMDDIRDTVDSANEISQAISQNLGIGAEVDEDELLGELEMLEQEELDKQMLGIEGSKSTIPKTALPEVRTNGRAVRHEEEDDLAALEAEMNA